MTDSILIGKAIYWVLSTDNQLDTYVDGRIWPLVAPYKKPEDMIFPFIVYTKTSILNRSYDKAGTNDDVVNFNIIVESPKYEESIDIANIVRSSFENHHILFQTLDITDIKLNGIMEEYSADVFIQNLSFRCIVGEREYIAPAPTPTPTQEVQNSEENNSEEDSSI